MLDQNVVNNFVTWFFLPHHMVCGLLVPIPEIELVPPAVEAQSFKHWAAREVTVLKFLIHNLKIVLLEDFIAKFPSLYEKIISQRYCFFALYLKLLYLIAEKAMAPHSSTLALKIPWTEKPGGLRSMGLLRVGHDWATSLSLSCIGEGNSNPLQCSCLENPRDRVGYPFLVGYLVDNLVGYRLWGHTESDTTEVT